MKNSINDRKVPTVSKLRNASVFLSFEYEIVIGGSSIQPEVDPISFPFSSGEAISLNSLYGASDNPERAEIYQPMLGRSNLTFSVGRGRVINFDKVNSKFTER